MAFALDPRERIRGVILALNPSRTCRGKVVDRSGAPAPRARLRVWMPPHLAAAGPEDRDADDQGSFEYPAVHEAVLEARHAGAVARAQVGFRGFADCAVTLRLGPPRHGETGAISGRVEGPSGQPAPGLMVETRARPDWTEEPRYAFARAVTGADGRFELGPLDDLGYDVVALHRGQAVASAERVKAGSGDVVLRELATGRVRGTVRDADGAVAVTSFSVLLMAARGGVARQPAAHTRYDARGDFDIEEIPPGKYSALVVGKGYAPSEPQPLEIRPAEIAASSFTPGRGSRVHGQVIDRQSKQPMAGAEVSLEGRRAGAATMLPLSAATITDARGHFENAGAPPGRRSLLATAPRHHGRLVGGLDAADGKDVGPVVVELAALKPGEVRRVETVGVGAMFAAVEDGLVFRKVMPGTVAAEAGLSAGDVVLAIDGTNLRGLPAEDSIQRIRGPEGSVITLRVRRATDGKVADVELVRRPVTGPR